MCNRVAATGEPPAPKIFCSDGDTPVWIPERSRCNFMLRFYTKNDGFCTKNDGLCTKNDGLCTKNDGL